MAGGQGEGDRDRLLLVGGQGEGDRLPLVGGQGEGHRLLLAGGEDMCLAEVGDKPQLVEDMELMVEDSQKLVSHLK